MAKWLRSGRRRDLCALLYETDDLRGQQLKTTLERHYEERIDPQSFYAALERLVELGFVVRETEGIYDVYRLSDAGVRRVEAHYAWLTDRMESRDRS